MTQIQEMPKTYTPQEWEEQLYTWWEESGFFRPEQQEESGLADPKAKPFVISMPPPNVTGALHLGHAITSSIEDLLIRYNRMNGAPTLWVPGTDHAGIATQNVVERKLAEQGVTRHDLGRDRFVQEVWDWKDEYHGRISRQQRRMGISCDWNRERFTLDDGLSDAVLEAFIRLYDEGLIYRGNYLVNWCPRCESAISDLEVDHLEIDGKLYTFRYPLKDGGHLEVSTTRPETILGDTAVAVHPEDERYKDVVGKTALVPILGREIPVIADEHVDPSFGTGALKVTPGHDPNDYEIAGRHDLPYINIMNKDATLNAEAGPYAGMDRLEARHKLWADMAEQGLVVGEKPHVHQVGHCERCGTVVEPLLSTQWFVRMKPLAEPAIEAVRDGRIKIVPERFDRIYFNWMENIRDWCISRQLWWGHR
ncbi:MAG: valine--tRNA ligase, partial [Caldilineaceae bacterium]|nr:valine--tRNA ligase [Caldilineaceae bacterium]